MCLLLVMSEFLCSSLEGVQQSELLIPAELTVSFRADKGSESVMRAPVVIYTDTADQQTAVTLKSKTPESIQTIVMIYYSN